jgi:hypothetical protein
MAITVTYRHYLLGGTGAGSQPQDIQNISISGVHIVRAIQHGNMLFPDPVEALGSFTGFLIMLRHSAICSSVASVFEYI